MKMTPGAFKQDQSLRTRFRDKAAKILAGSSIPEVKYAQIAYSPFTPLSGTVFPTGNVVFTIGSATQTVALNASGIATYTGTAPATPGPLSASAAFQGSTEFSASTSNTLNETIVAMGTSTVLSTSASQISEGNSVTLTATVTPASGSASPAGTVQFYDGTVLLGTSTLNAGVATISTIGLPVGADSLTASYLGGGGFAASNSASITVTVSNPLNPAPAVTSLSPALTSMGGGGFTLTVNGSGFTTGSIAYWGTAPLATQFVSPTPVNSTGSCCEHYNRRNHCNYRADAVTRRRHIECNPV
jgi:hypothetical protein